MYRVLVGLLLLSLLACDQEGDRSYAQLDARLSAMSGSNERQLLGAMGRIPDRSYQVDNQVKVLQWRWDPAYVSPACTPRRAIRSYSPDLGGEDCVVEWTVAQGVSQRYRWQGHGCGSATIVSSPPP
jgi:hypothetical protein